MTNALRSLACLALAACAVSSSYAQGHAVGSCAAYSADGTLSEAKLLKPALDVNVTSRGVPTFALRMPLRLSGNTCHAYFSSNNQFLAISIEDSLHPHAQVQIAVADVRNQKWVQATPFAALLAEDARGSLVGFLGTTHVLLVLSAGTYFPEENRSLLYPVFIAVPEGTVRTSLVAISGPPFGGGSGAIDVAGGRIWHESKESCGFQSTLFDDKDKKNTANVASIKGASLTGLGCIHPEVLFAPSAGRLLVGFSNAGKFVIAEAEVDSAHLNSVMVPTKGRNGFLEPVATAATADGKFAAIQFKRFEEMRSGLKRTATEVLMLNTDPFTLHSTVRIPAESRMLAIDDSGGELSIAISDEKGKFSIVKGKSK